MICFLGDPMSLRHPVAWTSPSSALFTSNLITSQKHWPAIQSVKRSSGIYSISSYIFMYTSHTQPAYTQERENATYGGHTQPTAECVSHPPGFFAQPNYDWNILFRYYWWNFNHYLAAQKNLERAGRNLGVRVWILAGLLVLIFFAGHSCGASCGAVPRKL